MKNLYVEVTHETYECGEPGCCYDAWDIYSFKANGRRHSFDDRSGSSLLQGFLQGLGCDNWPTAVTGTRFGTEPCAADGSDALQVRVDDHYGDSGDEVVSCELEVRRGGIRLLQKTFQASDQYLHDERWLAREVLAALGWDLHWC